MGPRGGEGDDASVGELDGEVVGVADRASGPGELVAQLQQRLPQRRWQRPQAFTSDRVRYEAVVNARRVDGLVERKMLVHQQAEHRDHRVRDRVTAR